MTNEEIAKNLSLMIVDQVLKHPIEVPSIRAQCFEMWILAALNECRNDERQAIKERMPSESERDKFIADNGPDVRGPITAYVDAGFRAGFDYLRDRLFGSGEGEKKE